MHVEPVVIADRRSALLHSLFPFMIVGLLVLVLYASVIKGLVLVWWDDPDYSHGFLVPVVAALVMWNERQRYARISPDPSPGGLFIVLTAVVLLVGGSLAADFFVPRFSLCLLLGGLVAFFYGWQLLRALAFPLAYLLLMVPLPGIIHNQITFPLQLLASDFAARLIELTGIPIFREGNLLRVPHYAVEVVQACSGIRSLLSLLALGIAYSYFAERRPWVRVGLVILMVPIAVFTNALRITVTSLLGYKYGPQWAEGFLHAFSGWFVFVVAIILLFFMHTLVARIGMPGKSASNA